MKIAPPSLTACVRGLVSCVDSSPGHPHESARQVDQQARADLGAQGVACETLVRDAVM